MTEQTQLWCDEGKHMYLRDKQRGRKPKNCPDHTPEEIKVYVKKEPTKKSLEELVPGITEVLEKENMRKYWCEAPGEEHEWEAPSRRGRPPRFCSEHTQTGQEIRKIEQTEQSREKAREGIREKIQSLSARVAAAAELDNLAYEDLIAEQEEIHQTEEIFNNWIKYNARLLNEVTALRAQERKLEVI